ncbi:MAG TPA: alpha/beta hydrolase [Myxococcus sp.]|nr:alpha/beta hydrolase [Myxococcus sp.]
MPAGVGPAPARTVHSGPVLAFLTLLHILGCLLVVAVFFAPSGAPALLNLLKGILREYSLVLLLPALMTVLVTAWAWRAGVAGWLRWSAGAGALLVLSCAVMPAASAGGLARTHGLPLSLREYFRPLVDDRPPPDQTVRFATVEGRELRADVFLPEGTASGPRPAVLYLHGGGWTGGERGYGRAWARFFTSRGYAFFSLDYRRFPPATALKAPGDVKCGIGWLKAHAATWGIDPERLVLLGESAGGHLALLAAYTAGDARIPPSCEAEDTSVRAVISFYGPSELTVYARDGARGSRQNLEGYVGAPLETGRELYALLSPMTHVRPGLPPTLLLHGGADSVVPPWQSRALASRLEANLVPQQCFTLPYAEHGFDIWDGGFGRQLSRALVERFLQRHVPVEGPRQP